MFFISKFLCRSDKDAFFTGNALLPGVFGLVPRQYNNSQDPTIL